MKVVRGVDEGRKALARGSLSGHQAGSPEILEGIRRIFGEDLTPEEAVRRIISAVERRGDDAVKEYSRRIDRAELTTLEMSREEILRVAAEVPEETRAALERASRRVREFQTASLPRTWIDMERGFGELVTPLERVGVYIPGGSASYPSTVLMTVIPAKVAGVKEVVLATPPSRGQGPHPAVMAAAVLSGVDRVFQVGGAQAIAAMAYGTESIPKVDMICGPGNIFVTLAKKMVYGEVNIDGLEGPTETLIIADESANPALCAADLLAQAEHDLLATPLLISTSESLVPSIQRELQRQMDGLARGDTARTSVERRGVIVVLETLEEALDLAGYYAPEHLSLMIKEPWASVGKVRNAGGIFLGDYSPEVMGDYVAGPSHVMPTGGTARFNSYLGVSQFLRRTPVVALDPQTALRLARTAATIARAEGFEAHARAGEAPSPGGM
ncbi:MAG: histidinol dehydrogenase [Dehalococcoidia bacterium]|nr:histidinol dehydrogenase [Dehalococcoidia bacterium]